MTADTLGIWITATAVVIGTLLTWWRGRRSVSIPFYRVLKASQDDDSDDYHWVKVVTALAPGPPVYDPRGHRTSQPPPSRTGKVVKITRASVTLDSPWGGNQTIALAVIHGVKRNEARQHNRHDDWVPCLDADRKPDDPFSPTNREDTLRRTQ